MPLLEANDVSRRFVSRSALGRVRSSVQAVKDVSLSIAPGETLGIVGESGSGKSTLGRLLVGLLEPDSGEVRYEGGPVRTKGREAMRNRRNIQMVFQDPYSSLDPSKTIAYTITEPLVVNRIGDRESRRERARWLTERVGLRPHFLERYPYELSGGQRQRVAVARALAMEPKLLVCDEPVSALDVSTQAQVVNLLRDLQKDLGIAIVFISHDMSVVRNISHRIAVMYLGEIVETGPCVQVLDDPRHDYTRTLLAAVPGSGRLRAAADLVRASDVAVEADVSAPVAEPVTSPLDDPSPAIDGAR